MPFLVLIGVSVSGKTTITREIKRRHVSDVFYLCAQHGRDLGGASPPAS